MPDREQPKSEPLLPAVRAARQSRLTLGGGAGFEATTLGAVMVGAVTGAYFLGSWLDHHFGTTFWMPVTVMVGAVGGLFEMIRTALRIGKKGVSAGVRKAGEVEPLGWQDEAEVPAVQERSTRGVPPPPEPSWARQGHSSAGRDKVAGPELDGLLQQVDQLKKMKESLDNNTIRRNE